MTKESREQMDIRLRFQPMSDSPNGTLFKYLLKSHSDDYKDMILQAVRAFWLPFALKAMGRVRSLEELQDISRVSISFLMNQISQISLLSGVQAPMSFSGHAKNTENLTQKHPRPEEQKEEEEVEEQKEKDDTWDGSIEDM